MTKGSYSLLVQACVTLLAGAQAHAFDPIGHGLVATTGAKLIHDTPLKKLLLAHDDLLGAAAGFPDVLFRKLSTQVAGWEAEAPNHFFHLDDAKVIPNFKALRNASCPKALEILGREATRSGVSPWRAEQFERLARADFKAGRPIDAVYHLGLGSHMIADHAIPWHSMHDAHGNASGHSNIHIFLEGCTDSFLAWGGDRFDPEFVQGIEEAAKKRRNDLLVFLEKDASATLSIALRGLEEGRSRLEDFESLDTEDNFLSGRRPKPDTPRDSPDAARKGEACLKFKPLMKNRLATAAAFVSIYYDLLQKAYKGGDETPPAGPREVDEYAAKPYIWFECLKP